MKVTDFKPLGRGVVRRTPPIGFRCSGHFEAKVANETTHNLGVADQIGGPAEGFKWTENLVLYSSYYDLEGTSIKITKSLTRLAFSVCEKFDFCQN